MKRHDFRKLVAGSPLLLDAGIMAQCDTRVCPGIWILEHFKTIAPILTAFKNAGSRIIRCPTPEANRYRLNEFGLASQTKEINRELMHRSRETLDDTFIFGTCSTTAMMVEPFGALDFDEAVACFSEQGKALVEGGADGFIIENMTDIQEARAALIALRELGDYPVMVHMEFGPDQRTVNSTDPLSALITLQSLGAEAVGFGVNGEPEAVVAIIENIKPFATVPLLALSSAGGMSADKFGSAGLALVAAGVNVIGGDASVTPEHIASLSNRLLSRQSAHYHPRGAP